MTRTISDPFAIRRRRMVERQLTPRGITDPRVLSAMGSIPRHLFVEEALRGKAYSDNALPIGLKQTISQPYIVALMMELLRVSPANRVLEIGTGSGYQTAVLAALGGPVLSIERIESLSRRAGTVLASLSIETVTLIIGDGTEGCPEEAPFDRIVVSAGAPSVPAPLLAQLAPGGRLVIPVGDEGTQIMHVVARGPSGFRTEQYDRCAFVKLIGNLGWAEMETKAEPNP